MPIRKRILSVIACIYSHRFGARQRKPVPPPPLNRYMLYLLAIKFNRPPEEEDQINSSAENILAPRTKKPEIRICIGNTQLIRMNVIIKYRIISNVAWLRMTCRRILVANYLFRPYLSFVNFRIYT